MPSPATADTLTDPALEPLSRLVSDAGLNLCAAVAATGTASYNTDGPGAQVAHLLGVYGTDATVALIRATAHDKLYDDLGTLIDAATAVREAYPHRLRSAAESDDYRTATGELREAMTRLQATSTAYLAAESAPALAASPEMPAVRLLWEAFDTDQRRAAYRERAHLLAAFTRLLAVLAEFGLVEHPMLCRNGTTFPEWVVLYWWLPNLELLITTLTETLGPRRPVTSPSQIAHRSTGADRRQLTHHIHPREEHLLGHALHVAATDPFAPVWTGADKTAQFAIIDTFTAPTAPGPVPGSADTGGFDDDSDIDGFDTFTATYVTDATAATTVRVPHSVPADQRHDAAWDLADAKSIPLTEVELAKYWERHTLTNHATGDTDVVGTIGGEGSDE